MVVIINGAPTSGKSTFVEACMKLAKHGRVHEYSTVDFVKHLASECGWDGTKTAKNRKFLSDLKDLLTEWGDVPFEKSREMITFWNGIANENGLTYRDIITFIHCREPKEIQKFIDYYGPVECTTLLIRRPTVENSNQSNHADEEVFNYDYETVIWNDGSLSQLEAMAREYMKKIVGVNIL